MFRVGDRVWDFTFEWGEVTKIGSKYSTDDIDESYPVLVKFEGGNFTSYTLDGRYSETYTKQALFFDEIPIPPSALIRTRWRAKKEDVYWFIDSDDGLVKEVTEYNDFLDSSRFGICNYFKTKEEAQIKLDKILQTLKED